jgi:hypothetical protein
MATLSYAQLKAVWLQAAQGTKYGTAAWATLMAAIAMAESGGSPTAQNATDNNGTQTSWGLWQISNGTHSQVSPTWSNPVTNAQLAIQKLNSQGLGAWGTYTSGAYKQYVNGATPADTTGLTTGGGTTNATTTSFNPLDPSTWLSGAGAGITQGIAGSLGIGSVADLFERLGLILLGGILVIVGIIMMAGKGVTNIALTTAAPEAAATGAIAGIASDRAKERNEEKQYDQVMARKRDSAKGPAVRDEEYDAVPF